MNYIGSKYSLIDFIIETIEDVTGFKNGDNYLFCDLFAGTGVVGSNFRKRGCTLIANDIQYYSYILNKHFIENKSPIDISPLSELNSLTGKEGFIYKNYCEGSGSQRNYFTDYNGKMCDAMREKIEELHNNNIINDCQYYLFIASLINSIDKYANTASVYGAFLKHIKLSAQKKFSLELLPIISGPKGRVYNENANDLIKKISGDVLYLDPPYNSRRYCSNYHILETVARYDSPPVYGKTGLRDYQNQKSEFCSKKTVEKALDSLISNAKFKYIFLSYNNEGLLSLDTIKEIMSKYGIYSVRTINYHRFRADKKESRNHKANSTIEYLHCLIK